MTTPDLEDWTALPHGLLAHAHERVAELEAEVARLREALAKLEAENDDLREQLVQDEQLLWASMEAA